MKTNNKSNRESVVFKILGIQKVVISLLWIVISVIALYFGLRGIQDLEDKLDKSLSDVVLNVDVVSDLLAETIDIFEMVDQSLSTVERSAINASIATNGSSPIIEKTSKVIVGDVPKALENVQISMPSVVQAATAIDQSLRLLSKLKLAIPIPFSQDLEVGMGINYDPPVPLDDALTGLSENLEGIPESMRAIEGDLETAEINLSIIGDNLLDMARDIDYIREQIADINPGINHLQENLIVIRTSIQETQKDIHVWGDMTEKILIILMILIILGQIPSVYFGYLASRNRFVLQNGEKMEINYYDPN